MIAAGWHNYLAKRAREGVRKEVAEEAAVSKKERAYFRGSDTHGCGRKHYYTRRGVAVSNPFPPSAYEKMKKGNLLHDYIRQTVLPKFAGAHVYEAEEGVDACFTVEGTGVRILGNLDGIVKTPEGTFILEIKTTSSWGYKATVKAFAEGDQTHYSYGYFLQGNRYGFAWNETKPHPKYPKVDGVCILLYNVNGDEDPDTGLCWRDYWFHLDYEALVEDVTALATVEREIRSGQEPERRYREIGWECIGCQWFSRCWPRDQRTFVDAKMAAKARELEAGAGGDPEGSVAGGSAPAGRGRRRVPHQHREGGTSGADLEASGQTTSGGQVAEVSDAPAKRAQRGGRVRSDRGSHRRGVGAEGDAPVVGGQGAGTARSRRKQGGSR